MIQTLINAHTTPTNEEPNLTVASWREGNALFLELRGEVDMHTVSHLQEAITEGLKDTACTEVSTLR